MTRVVLFLATLSAASAAVFNGTAFAAAPGLSGDACALDCVSRMCAGRERRCLCDYFDTVASAASTECIRVRCPGVQPDDVVGRLRDECFGKPAAFQPDASVVPGGESSSSRVENSSRPEAVLPAMDSSSQVLPTLRLPLDGVVPPGGESPVQTLSATATATAATLSGSTNVPVLTTGFPQPLPTDVPTAIPNTRVSPLPPGSSALMAPPVLPSTASTSTGKGITSTLATRAPSPSKAASNSAAPAESEESDANDGDLSVAAKVGIAISVSLICVTIMSTVAFLYWRRRRNRNADLGEDTIYWMQSAGEKHRTPQGIPAFAETQEFQGSGADWHPSAGDASATTTEHPSGWTSFESGLEQSPEYDGEGIGIALSPETHRPVG